MTQSNPPMDQTGLNCADLYEASFANGSSQGRRQHSQGEPDESPWIIFRQSKDGMAC